MISHDREFHLPLGKHYRHQTWPASSLSWATTTSTRPVCRARRNSASRRLQKPAEGDPVPPGIRRPLSRQGQQGIPGAEQAPQIERMDKIEAPMRGDKTIKPDSPAATQRLEGHLAGRHRPGLRETCGLSWNELFLRSAASASCSLAPTARANALDAGPHEAYVLELSGRTHRLSFRVVELLNR